MLEATTDGAAFLAAHEVAFAAHRAQATAGRFGKRTAARIAKDADILRTAAERFVPEFAHRFGFLDRAGL